jgi:hypothetical protein
MTQPIENEATGTNDHHKLMRRYYRGDTVRLRKGEGVWVQSHYGLVRVLVCEKTGYPIIEVFGVSNPLSGVKYTKRTPKGMPMTLTPNPRTVYGEAINENGDA